MIVNDILKLKEKIENEKELQARNKGKLDHIKQELKKLGCDSVVDTEKKITELDNEIDTLEKELKECIETFKEKYQL